MLGDRALEAAPLRSARIRIRLSPLLHGFTSSSLSCSSHANCSGVSGICKPRASETRRTAFGTASPRATKVAAVNIPALPMPRRQCSTTDLPARRREASTWIRATASLMESGVDRSTIGKERNSIPDSAQQWPSLARSSSSASNALGTRLGRRPWPLQAIESHPQASHRRGDEASITTCQASLQTPNLPKSFHDLIHMAVPRRQNHCPVGGAKTS